MRLVVHYLYGRLPRRRPLIRKVFAEILSNVISLNDRVCGVDEILTVYNSIVCGFTLPIKEEHVHFLKHCILPLHKLNGLMEYSSTLSRCVLLFVTREASLCVPVRDSRLGDDVGDSGYCALLAQIQFAVRDHGSG